MDSCQNCRLWDSKNGIKGKCLSENFNKMVSTEISGTGKSDGRKPSNNVEINTWYNFGCNEYTPFKTPKI